MKPRSPRDAHSRTVDAPRSANRANVPPHASDSSSGWAKTARIVRPARLGVSRGVHATVSLHKTPVNGHVLVHHAVAAEPGDRALTHTPTIDREHVRQTVHHFVQAAE